MSLTDFEAPSGGFARENPSVLTRKEQNLELFPTLVIGLGLTGYVGLRLLKQALLQRGLGVFPKSVHLLWLGSVLRSSELGEELSTAERHIFSPNFNEITRSLEQNIRMAEQFSWWMRGRAFDHGGRADGRMALYWELYFTKNGELSYKLDLAARELTKLPNDQFQVFWLASACEPETAFLPDLANLLKKWFGNRIALSVPWTLLHPFEEEHDKYQQSAWRIATMRELQRFQSGREQAFDPSNLQKQGFSPPITFETIFLADRPGALDSTVHLQMTLMEKTIATAFRTGLGQVNPKGVSAAGCFRFIYPLEAIRKACATRLILEKVLKEPSQIDSINWREQAEAFFRDETEGLSAYLWPFILFVEPKQAQLQNRPWPRNLEDGLRWRLQEYLNRVAPLRWKRFGYSAENVGWLTACESFLDAVQQVLNDGRAKLQNDRKFANSTEGRTLLGMTDRLRGVVREYREQIAPWKKASEGIGKTVLKTYKRLVDAIPVKDDDQQTVVLSEEELAMSSPDDAQYYRFLRSNGGKLAIQHLQERLFWYWDQDLAGRARLRWYVCDAQKRGDEELQDSLYLVREVERIYPLLNELGDYLTQWMSQQVIIFDQLRRRNMQSLLSPLSRVQSLLQLEQTINQDLRITNWLVGADTQVLTGWLNDVPVRIDRECVLKSSDYARIVFLHLEHGIELRQVRQLNQDAEMAGGDATVFAHSQEQIAVQLERQVLGSRGKFGPHFTSLMLQRQAFEVAMQCVFFDWIQKSFENVGFWQILYPVNNSVNEIRLVDPDVPLAESLEDALRSFLVYFPLRSLNHVHPLHTNNFNQTIENLRNALDRSSNELTENLQSRIKDRIDEWESLGAREEFYRDLALYQKYLFRKLFNE